MMVEFKGKTPDDVQTDESARGAAGKTRGKTQGKTPDIILEILRKSPHQTVSGFAEEISKSESAVQRAALKLQANGCLKRIGGRKEGRWEVLEK